MVRLKSERSAKTILKKTIVATIIAGAIGGFSFNFTSKAIHAYRQITGKNLTPDQVKFEKTYNNLKKNLDSAGFQVITHRHSVDEKSRAGDVVIRNPKGEEFRFNIGSPKDYPNINFYAKKIYLHNFLGPFLEQQVKNKHLTEKALEKFEYLNKNFQNQIEKHQKQQEAQKAREANSTRRGIGAGAGLAIASKAILEAKKRRDKKQLLQKPKNPTRRKR